MLRATLRHLRPAHAAASAQAPVGDDGATDAEAGPITRFHGPDADRDPAAARRMGLSAAEVEFFKEFGFVVSSPARVRSRLAGS